MMGDATQTAERQWRRQVYDWVSAERQRYRDGEVQPFEVRVTWDGLMQFEVKVDIGLLSDWSVWPTTAKRWTTTDLDGVTVSPQSFGGLMRLMKTWVGPRGAGMKVYVCDWCDSETVVFSTYAKAAEFVQQSSDPKGWVIFERNIDDPTDGIDKAIDV